VARWLGQQVVAHLRLGGRYPPDDREGSDYGAAGFSATTRSGSIHFWRLIGLIHPPKA